MHADPFPNTYTDRGELPVFHPNAGESVAAASIHAEAGAGADERVFEFTEVLVEVFATRGEIENRIADELTGAVIGRLAAAVCLVNGVGECCWISQG